jgi:drug/metabolite transporter (DMT)-like permease
MTLDLGILLALLCALATNLGFLYKHRGAAAAVPVDGRHPLRSAKGLFSCGWFAIGMGVATGAWGLHVAAMALAPLSVVQTVLSGGVVLLAVMAERLFGFRVGRRQWAGVALTGTGLMLLALSAPHTGADSGFSTAGMIAVEAGLIAVGMLLTLGPRLGGRVEHHGVMLGGASGILFGVSDIAIKALTGVSGPVAVLVSPWLIVAIIASIAAFFISARSLQVGDAVPVIATTTTAANVAGIMGGIVVFGDPLPGDALGIVVEFLAFTMVCFAAWLTPAPLRAAGARA